MAISAKPANASNNDGMTDKGRGDVATVPRAAPNGRTLSRKGKLGEKSNDNSPEGVHRRATAGGKSGATNGAV